MGREFRRILKRILLAFFGRDIRTGFLSFENNCITDFLNDFERLFIHVKMYDFMHTLKMQIFESPNFYFSLLQNS